MNKNELLDEIGMVFPVIAMPDSIELKAHPVGCHECQYQVDYLEENARDKVVTGDIIRYLCMDMNCLSAKGWAWILPHYLRFCVKSFDPKDPHELEFLIYTLAPSDESVGERKEKLSLLSVEQINCIIHFIEWFRMDKEFNDYCSKEIDRALRFLNLWKN